MLSSNIADLNVTKHILKAFKLHASKNLGQNFLVDNNIIREIVAASKIQEGEEILEIGPGIGTLTQKLLEQGAKVTAVEIDKKLVPVLKEIFQGEQNFRLVEGDILKIDILKLMENSPFKVVANLPYYITTPILLKFLEEKLPFTFLITMVQKEVALRMVAQPSTKDYGALTLAINYYTEPHIVMDVPATSFYPSPKVTSAVIICKKRATLPTNIKNEKIFFRLVRSAFNQRRKTLFNALQSGNFSKERLKIAAYKAQVDLKRRGETLALEEFLCLSNALQEVAGVDKSL